MITTISKQGGRRYPQMGSTGLPWAGWIPSFGETTPPAPVSTRDTHDGYREEVVPGFDEPRALKRRKDELRAAIIEAIDGPQAEAVQQAIAPFLEAGVPFVPAAPSIDWDAMLADIAAIERINELLALRRRLFAEDEEILRLL